MCEAVINALVHRSYRSKNPVKVSVYEDRVEFDSPGGVVQGQNPRNPMVLALSRMMGYSGVGGLRAMAEGCTAAGLRPPEIYDDGDHTILVIRRNRPARRAARTTNVEGDMLAMMVDDPGISFPEIMARMRRPADEVRRLIKSATGRRMLLRLGSSKDGKWAVMDWYRAPSGEVPTSHP